MRDSYWRSWQVFWRPHQRPEKQKRFQVYESVHDEIIAWYDDYSWDGETRVINPLRCSISFNRENSRAFCIQVEPRDFWSFAWEKTPTSKRSVGGSRIPAYSLLLKIAACGEISGNPLSHWFPERSELDWGHYYISIISLKLLVWISIFSLL